MIVDRACHTGQRPNSSAKLIPVVRITLRYCIRYRNVQWFRGGLVFEAQRLLDHSTLGLRVIKKKKKCIRELPAECRK